MVNEYSLIDDGSPFLRKDASFQNSFIGNSREFSKWILIPAKQDLL